MGRRRRPQPRRPKLKRLNVTKKQEGATKAKAKTGRWPKNPCCTENLLTTMPSVVVLQILDYLEFQDLKTLRQVCLETKAWVEQPRYLRKLPVQIPDTECLSQLRESTVPWTTFRFPLVIFRDNGSAKLLQQFRPSLKSVTIGDRGSYCFESFTPRLIDNYLLHLGPELESLFLYGNFHLTTYLGQGQDLMEFERKQLKTLHFPSLRTLEYVPPHSLKADWICPLVEILLAACPNLTSIKLPILTSRCESWAVNPGAENPFIAYLKALGQKPRSERPSNFTLDFCSNWTLIDRNGLSISDRRSYGLTPGFKLDKHTLIQLAVLCLPIGGQLVNVPIASLPTRREILTNKFCSKLELYALTQCVQSVIGKDEQVEAGTAHFHIPNPSSTAISLLFNVDPDADFSNFDLPTDALVTSLSLTAPWVWDGIINPIGFLSSLFDSIRPSVTDLRLKGEIAFLDSIRISDIFPNLRTVFLFNGRFGNVVQTLPVGLEELYMFKCNLSPEFFYEAEGVRTRKGSWRRLRFARFKKLTKVKLRLQYNICECDRFSRFESDLKQLRHLKICDVKDDWSW